MTEKLDTKLVAEEIKQNCSKKEKLVFRDSGIDKVDPKKIVFGIRRELLIKFDVPKGSSNFLMLLFFKKIKFFQIY